ncbi:MAG TPA: thioredoxin domain-containing protein [Actinomycetota bacterium]
MEIAKKRKAIDLKSHTTYAEQDGAWVGRFELLGITVRGESEEEAKRLMVETIRTELEENEALRAVWEEFVAENTVEIEIPEDERAAMRAVVDAAHEASESFPVLTAESFDDFITSDVPTLVDFWAEWCMPCHHLAPTLKEVADELEGRMRVAKLNVDEHRAVPERHHVEGYPTMILFAKGEERFRMVGSGRSREQMIAELEPYLG